MVKGQQLLHSGHIQGKRRYCKKMKSHDLRWVLLGMSLAKFSQIVYTDGVIGNVYSYQKFPSYVLFE